MVLAAGRGGWFWVAAVGIALLPTSAHAEFAYQVKEGDTLWGIARKHGCDPQTLARENQVAGGVIYPGARLKIPRCTDGAASSAALAVVSPARRPMLTLERPKPAPETRPVPGQSIGYPFAGRLINAAQLPPGPGYYRRRPTKSYGAGYVVENLRRAIAAVMVEHPTMHRVAVGDLSARRGGPITQHNSHQSGRDVDVGFFFKKKPAGYPRSFVKGTHKNLHFSANWLLLQTLLRTAGKDGGVERIYLSYDTQRLFYETARAKGVSERDLGAMFQYPHGKYAARGLIRHEPNHDDHFHIRWKCLDADDSCR